MKKIRIVAAGKALDPLAVAYMDEYEKRISRYATLEWRFLSHQKSVREESQAILKAIGEKEFVVLLDERGEQLTTPYMSKQIDGWIMQGRSLVFVIGGAFGVDTSVYERADFVWSFSKMVFPHQLMRVLLIEQLYRMFNYQAGGKYHHD